MVESKNKMYVGNLEYSVNEEELRNAFEEKGVSVVDVKIVKDKYTGKSKGFGFVEVSSEEVMQKGIEAMNGQDLKGRSLKVNKARPPRPRNDHYSGARRPHSNW